MMNIYYDTFDSDSPIASAAMWLLAAAGRFALSIAHSFVYLPNELRSRAEAFFSIGRLWSLALVLAAWAIATILGGPVALAVNALLALYGFVELWGELKTLATLATDWASKALHARDDQALETAAAACAKFLTEGGLATLELVVLHRTFRAAETRLTSRFPPPDWLGSKLQRNQMTKPRSQTRTKLNEAAETAATTARGKGAVELANTLDHTPLLVTGSVVVATVLGVVVVASIASRK
jgi:hypothetical protein